MDIANSKKKNPMYGVSFYLKYSDAFTVVFLCICGIAIKLVTFRKMYKNHADALAYFTDILARTGKL